MTKILFATLLAFSATPALAEPVTVTSTVQVADLDLSKAKDRRTLDRRLQLAVQEVCGSASEADIAGKNEVRRCRSETFAAMASECDQRIARATGESIEVAAR